MPCWEVNLMTVEFRVDNIDNLKEAARMLDWQFKKVREGYYRVKSYLISTEKNEISSTSPLPDFVKSEEINLLKRTYSLATVKNVAKSGRWSVRVKGSNKLELRRF